VVKIGRGVGGRQTVNFAVGSVMKEEVVPYRGLILLLFRVNDLS
jgi:hypothetical protein